jgi:hypothetical protein
MARPWRMEFEGSFQNVLHDSNEKRDIFMAILGVGDRSSVILITDGSVIVGTNMGRDSPGGFQ